MVNFKFFSLVIILLGGLDLGAQSCGSNAHSSNPLDSWVSCTPTLSPNPIRGTTHWIQYDLGSNYQLSTTRFWNYNVHGQTNRGMHHIQIDISVDGIVWLPAVSYELPVATGNNNYTGENGPDLSGFNARYILISDSENWGDVQCSGLSEVRFDIQGHVSTSVSSPAQPESFIIYPNPASESIYIDVENTENKELKILDINGREITRLAFQNSIDIRFLPQGTYILQLKTSQGSTFHKKFIKL